MFGFDRKLGCVGSDLIFPKGHVRFRFGCVSGSHDRECHASWTLLTVGGRPAGRRDAAMEDGGLAWIVLGGDDGNSKY